jgi:nitrogen-specific signal transduction histidine kinase
MAETHSAEINSILENAKQQLEKMIDLTPQGMMLIDHQGCVLRANERVVSLLGRDGFDQILGKSVPELFAPDESSAEALHEFVCSSNLNRSVELHLPTEDDDTLILLFTRVASGNDSDLNIILIEDHTQDRKRETRKEKRDKLEGAMAASGALQHYVNQPLTVIVCTAHLLMHEMENESLSDEKLRSGLTEIISNVNVIADTLRESSSLDEYITKPYPGSADIIDLDHVN